MPSRAVLALLLAAATATPPALQELAPGVHLLRGSFVTGHQPDGNSVVWRAPAGLIIFDTGRHAEHTQRLIDYAQAEHRPVAAIVNSHWHLDHVSGNAMLREAYPQVKVYASDAIREAMTGFLARYRRQLSEMIAKETDQPAEQAEHQAEIRRIDAGPRLAPDEIVSLSGPRTIAGRPVFLGLATHAVTAADVWLLDPETGVLAAGDLVTVPVPFLDTACPRGWSAALDELAQHSFTTLVPGHGATMNRKDLDDYRHALSALISCAATTASETQCADAWFHDGGPQMRAADNAASRDLLRYYVDNVLRGDPAKTAAYCTDAAPVKVAPPAAAGEKADGGCAVIEAATKRQGLAAEGRWLHEHYPGWTKTSQALLVGPDQRSFDRLEILDAQGAKHEVCFDITSFFGKM